MLVPFEDSGGWGRYTRIPYMCEPSVWNLLPAGPCERLHLTKIVHSARHHAGRLQIVTVLHGRDCTQCTSIGKSGLDSHDTVLEPVLHKLGKMICCVRVTIMRYSSPRRNVDAAAAVLRSILAVALQEDWLSGSFRMRQRSIPMLFIVA